MAAHKGTGVGLVVLLVVLVVVLLLVARASRETVPLAVKVAPGSGGPATTTDHGQPEALEALGELPNLDQMRSRTGDHAKAVSEALEATE